MPLSAASILRLHCCLLTSLRQAEIDLATWDLTNLFGRFPSAPWDMLTPRRTFLGTLDSLFQDPEHPPKGGSIRSASSFEAINVKSIATGKVRVGDSEDEWLLQPFQMTFGAICFGDKRPKFIRNHRVYIYPFNQTRFVHLVPL